MAISKSFESEKIRAVSIYEHAHIWIQHVDMLIDPCACLRVCVLVGTSYGKHGHILRRAFLEHTLLPSFLPSLLPVGGVYVA